MAVSEGSDFLEFHDLPAEAVLAILKRAGELGEAWRERRMPKSLEGRRVALIVDDGGWRNTTAFDLGIQAMGGICTHVPASLGGREAIADLAGYLDNWFDMIVVRTPELASLRELAANARAPVINARTRSNHPCETLGDLAYLRAKRGGINGLKIVGVAPDANILRSWVEASISLSIEVVQVYPDVWHVNDPALLNPNFRVSTDMRELEDADVIFTDSWPGGVPEGEVADYRISAEVLDRCRPDAVFIPCPPVVRSQEVTADAMTHAACQSTAAKAFLLHAQNALMEWITARIGV
ncbi:ornithine carbamoyltransferase [Neorhizobium galegae]|uniref:ornithine carbamoyltransferase n=1 Tax=Neorhizobium galegae TaxID=399 RepID=UPI0006223998|nr:ornithine carbamoyltransferase [Neorhizobium galegae]KAB1124181.1 ornithine carbamoyltransferase [Neorhizobium galegae]MCQ1809717.1 ornithine carbamoyltransferase [Neorhizobium galegae]CDZ56593.1 Ornithine carbamoyltransferase [Neorhizobium galegae bv. orientalis]